MSEVLGPREPSAETAAAEAAAAAAASSRAVGRPGVHLLGPPERRRVFERGHGPRDDPSLPTLDDVPSPGRPRDEQGYLATRHAAGLPGAHEAALATPSWLAERGWETPSVSGRDVAATAQTPSRRLRRRDVVAATPDVAQTWRGRRVLEDDEFSAQVATIVRREFFPDLPSLQA